MSETSYVADFIAQLTVLSEQMSKLFQTGDIRLFTEINRTVKEMHRIQHGSEEPILRAIEEDCQIIYQNFDMVIAVLKTTENGEIDAGAQTAMNKFLHNIGNAVYAIAQSLGLTQ